MNIAVAGETFSITVEPASNIDLSLPVAESEEGSTTPVQPEEEIPRGTTPYLETLATIHRVLEPALYLEIGVWQGSSLAQAHCPAIGIDPLPDIKATLAPEVQLFSMTSDQFFSERAHEVLSGPVDMAFIDGMHLLEFVLRDFMYVERHAGPGSLIVLDDAFPAHPAQAARQRRTGTWMGDVWKLYPVLSQVRPDLFLLPINTWPAGLLLVAGLDPKNETLWHTYNQIVRHLSINLDPPQEVLDRVGVYPPTVIEPFLHVLKSLRHAAAPPAQAVTELRAIASRL